MAKMFELKGKEAIFDMKEFCRLKDELTYVGRFANKETCKVLQGTIIQYDGKFYATEIPLRSGVGSGSADKDGMVTTLVELFETDYVPEECKPLDDCKIMVDVWDVNHDDEAPIDSYAFYADQLKEAKEIVSSNKDVDIFIDGKKVAKEILLAQV